MTEQLKVVIAAEINNFKQNVDAAKKKVKEFATKGIKDLDKFKEDLEAVGGASKKFLAVTAGAVAGAATALLALGNSTKEYRQQQAMLATAFETAGGSAESAKKTYNELYRVLGDSGQATEAAQHLAKLTTEEKSLSEWTNICQGVYATFGESLPIESLTEAVNHTAKVGEVQGALADALEWSGINMDEFNEQLFWCNSESEREKLIRDALNGVYGDAAAAYETNNAQILAQNEAQTRMTDAMAKLGEATAPIMTMLAELGADILAQLAPYIEEFAQKYLPDISKALATVGEAIGKVIGWIIEHWEIIKPIATIVLAIAAALSIVSTALGVYNAVMAITTVVSAPIILIILAIVAAVALLIVYWDEISAFTVSVWEGIKNAISRAVEAIKGAVQAGFAWINDKIVTPIKNAFNTIKETFSNIVSTIKEKLNSAKDAVKNIIDKIKGFFKFEWSLPKLKTPKFSITPSGWGVGDLLKGVIPKLSVTWNARGGVFDKPTLFNYGNSLQGIGENGAEAVVPLENNLEWLDKLATMLGDRMGSTPVVLNVDGKTFARTSINTINQLTRQTGRLGLVVT